MTLSCTVVFACVLAKNYTDEAQANKKAYIEKRNRLTESYEFDFWYSYEIILNEKRVSLDKTIAYELIDETEKNMRADGYDKVEINETRNSGRKKALHYLTKENEKK